MRRWYHPRGVCDFGTFGLEIDRRDHGGMMYESLTYWADLTSPIEAEIVERHRPSLFIDVGANYGFTTLGHHSLNPGCRFVAIEPSPRLLPYLRRNLDSNGLADAEILPQICSDSLGIGTISLNPSSSQDNRVTGEGGWASVSVGATTLDAITSSRVAEHDSVFIKVDTQGFEQQVMRGGESFLGANTNWIMRSEFAPYWLRSQGTDPVDLLRYLIDRYAVAELPKRARFRADSLASVRANTLGSDDIEEFVPYVVGLARDRGWCDLLIEPRS